jgi:filamentous hemagglutinin family protein
MKTRLLPLHRRFAACVILFAFALHSPANPAGLSISYGAATAQQMGSQLNITAGNNAVLNWQSFNIAAGEKTVFNQPSTSSIVWNRVNDPHPSQIFGTIQANGVVVVLNSSGFYFGPNSFVSAAGLVVSTANCVPPQNGGGSWEFNGPPPLASIVNYGTIKVGGGGSAFLIADKIENHGDIEAPGGSIGLAAGQTVTLSERPDGRGMSMNVLLPQGSVDNFGNLVADAGTVALNAKVVNQNGLIQADSVQNQNGVIELVAADSLALGAGSKILARGDDSISGSAGGTVTLKSENNFSDSVGSQIVTTGGAQGGNGGNVEVSAPNIASLASSMDAGALTGWSGGEFLLDPVNIVLGTSGSGPVPGSGTVGYNTSGTLNLDVNTAFANKNFSQILLQASGNITMNTGTTWDLSASTGGTAGQLTLQAGGDIIFGSGALITDANNWSLNLMAGVSFPSGQVQSGKGSIYLNGGSGKTLNGAIQLAQGNVRLTAGNDILVGSGYVRTVGGGSIFAAALAGNVNTGTDAAGYGFLAASSAAGLMYFVDPNLGGISTAAGGDVNISAGNDVISYLPAGTKTAGDAGCGAFGSAAGNVIINAVHNVTGHYVVANGTGSITAGNDAGAASAQLALSVINGGWNVNAAGNIVLQEVRNPNGIFNRLGFSGSTSKHYFDYAPGDFVNLTAGNSIELGSGSLPRNSGSFEAGLPEIFPGILNLVAGAGGVTIDRDLILFPSPQGSLTITTTAGGGLFGSPDGSLTSLTMSDSADAQYLAAAAFTGHAPVPVHWNSPTPVTLNIAGDMDNIFLSVNEAAQINVGGNMNNSRFEGQNLQAGEVTRINVTGDILNRNDFTSITLAAAPDFSLLGQAYPYSDFYSTLTSLLHYDAATKTLTFEGRMTGGQLAALTSLTIQLVDPDGTPTVDGSGNPVTKTVSILDSTTATALYNATQDIPSPPVGGYIIGGGGALAINARNMDLGATLGIQSIGPISNPALANYFTHGADINVSLTGSLDMFSTTICSLNGGNVNVNAGGYVNVGSSTFSGSDQVARGIFTVQKSDVTVIAGGDVNVNGSRIAAYDGGNVTVESLHGDINAGSGGSGSVSVEEVYVDPVTRQVFTYTPTIPGSGILATTFPPPLDPGFPASQNLVGNILVETPNGNINASAGGIVQLPLNSLNSPDSIVRVLAGDELRDSGGNKILAGNISSGAPVQVSNGRNIDASGSGVIGSTVKLDASGSITGIIFARNNIDISAQQNINVTALAQGNVSASAGGTVSGTLVGVGGVSASGSAIDATLLSQNVSASGDTSSAKEGFAQGTVANATASAASASDDSGKVAKTSATDDDEEAKKKGKGIVLAQKVSRVTVLLPAKSLSENQKSK